MNRNEDIANELTQNHYLIKVAASYNYFVITQWHYSRRDKDDIIFTSEKGAKMTININSLHKQKFIKLL